jgi:hypothetical protein
VLALVFMMVAAGAMLWRPEMILLAVAAFPWLDWAARGTLGGLGPLWDDALLVVSVGLLAWSVSCLGGVPIAPCLACAVTMAAAELDRRAQVPNDVALWPARAARAHAFLHRLSLQNTRWVRLTFSCFF